jgi:2'-5' RNA ligase
MRMFVALVPPDPVIEHLAEFVSPRQEAEIRFRWTTPDQWHVTLAFMADVRDRQLAQLTDRLVRAARRRTPFDVSIGGGGTFPDPARATVLYTGVDAGPAAEELRRLSVGARAAAGKAGAGVGGGAFHPHVTLARLRIPTDVTRWLRVLDAYRGPTWRAVEVSLIESHLGEGPRRRPRYSIVETFALGPPPGSPAA